MHLKLKDKFKKEAFKFKGDETEEKAIEKAYADMSRRATGHNEQMKTDCLAWLIEDEIFKNALNCKTQEDFDVWHKDTCIKLKEIHKDFGTIGRAQKVINMAFKYLSCVDSEYDAILPFCHMTLDSYTLNWYKNNVRKKEQKAPAEWSKIKDYYNEYYPIQEKIRNYLKNDPKYSIRIGEETTKTIDIPDTPFEAEFIIWEGEIINSKYNELVKSLNKYKREGQKNDRWLIGDIFDTYLNTAFKQ